MKEDYRISDDYFTKEVLCSLLDGEVVEKGKAGIQVIEEPMMQRMYSSVEKNRKGVEREIPFWEEE